MAQLLELIADEESLCPAEITVAGRPWTIQFVNEAAMHGRFQEGGEAPNGGTFGQTMEIVIGNWTHAYLQREVVLHEVIHACFYGGQFDGQMAEDTDPEEWMISGIDSPLLNTLRENPALVEYLLG